MNDVVVVEGLGKDFGAFTAVDSVDFTVRRQEIFGFLGPNGAGKTTTINMLATLLKPTRGRAELAGRPPAPPAKHSFAFALNPHPRDVILASRINLASRAIARFSVARKPAPAA